MQPVATSVNPAVHGNHENHEYEAILARLQRRLEQNVVAPLFTTNAGVNVDGGFQGTVANPIKPGNALWVAYLDALPEDQRPYHNCHACRHFIERFGDLVTIGEDGNAVSALWDPEDASGILAAPFAALARRVRRAMITGIHLSEERTWGQPITGVWRHLAVTPPKSVVYRGTTQTAFQAMAERRQDFEQVIRALSDFPLPVIEQALTVLRADALYRGEKVLGQAEWLAAIHVARNGAKGVAKTNLVWRAVASAPAGFCHPRASMIGTLLEDIAAGMPFEVIAQRFSAKMHPLQYQRPQAAPRAGAIAAAEKVMEQLGAAGSLARRFARVEEIQAIWTPRLRPIPPASGGVFGHLTPKGAVTPSSLRVPPQVITWEKLARTVLDQAAEIDFLVPHGRSNFGALLTAENADAPPILQWDREDRRNPFSWYIYNGGTTASQWGLAAGSWVRVTAITHRPSMWFDAKLAHQNAGALIVLAGAVDSQDYCGSALFPETLRSEFHGIRSTIEAYSKTARLGGRDQASACGFMLEKGGPCGAHIRVKSVGGSVEYRIDRWD